MVRAQGGDARVADDPVKYLPSAKRSLPLTARKSGFVTRLDALTAGRAAVALGAGRDRQEDKLDFGAGILLSRKVGDPVKAGDEIARVLADDPARLRQGLALLSSGVEVGPKRPRAVPIIRKVWR